MKGTAKITYQRRPGLNMGARTGHDAGEPQLLFDVCPVPVCHNPVPGPGQVCEECVALFGPYLQPSATTVDPEAFTAAMEAGDARVAEVFAERRAMTATPAG
jgi:hypothetical protein